MEELLAKIGEEIEILESVYADEGVVQTHPEIASLDRGEEEKLQVVKIVLNFSPITGMAQEKVACTMMLAFIFHEGVSFFLQ